MCAVLGEEQNPSNGKKTEQNKPRARFQEPLVRLTFMLRAIVHRFYPGQRGLIPAECERVIRSSPPISLSSALHAPARLAFIDTLNSASFAAMELFHRHS